MSTKQTIYSGKKFHLFREAGTDDIFLSIKSKEMDHPEGINSKFKLTDKECQILLPDDFVDTFIHNTDINRLQNKNKEDIHIDSAENINYCPVCGSEDIRKQFLESRKFTIVVDYYCNDCTSNGDLHVYVRSEEDE